MAINKKFIRFKTLENYQREYDAGNILPKSICFCADAKAIYLNGEQFSINSLYNLEQLLESGTELESTDHLDEAVVKLYNNIKLIQEDIENVENEHTELAKIVKLLASEIADLETGLKEEIATNAEITAVALNDLNTNLKALGDKVEEQKIPTIMHDPVNANVLTLSETAKAYNKEVLDTGYIGPVVIINNNNEKISTGTIFTAEKLNMYGASGVKIVYNCPYVEVIDQYGNTKKENYQYTQEWYGGDGSHRFNGILYYTTQSISLDSTKRQSTAVDGNTIYVSNDYDPRKDAVNLATEKLVYNSTIQTEHGNVGDVVFVDKESEVITAVPKELIKDIDPERYEPIGIVVVPSNHNMYGDGECGIIAMHCLSQTTPDTGCEGDSAESIAYGDGEFPTTLPKISYWDYTGSLQSGPNYEEYLWYSNDQANNPVFPQEDKTGIFSIDRRTRFIADPDGSFEELKFRKYTSPYNAQLKANPSYINKVHLYPSVNNHFCGKEHNDMLLNSLTDETWKTSDDIANTDFPLAISAWRYHTIGTKQGDWYVPTALEVGYALNMNVTITNSALELEKLYGRNFAGIPAPVWSINAYKDYPTQAAFVFGEGGVAKEPRSNTHYAIAFTTMKLSYTETIKDRLNRLEKRAIIPEGGTDSQVLVWDYEGHAKWEDINKVLPLDTISYGVEWDINVADPHLTRIGNPEFHKTLPIQSKLRGCVAQGNNIMYWLDPDDWNYREDFKKNPINGVYYKWQCSFRNLENNNIVTIGPGISGFPSNLEAGVSVNLSITRTIQDSPNTQPTYESIDFGRGVVTETTFDSIMGTISQAKIKLDTPVVDDFDTEGLSTGSITVISRLDGYDGTVRVYVPEFYIKSYINGNKRQVRISETCPNSTWTKQPACLVDAYPATVLNTVPEDMGYLSTLPVNSAVSIANTATYCRGGDNREAYDQYLETDPFKADLGKPRTNLTRGVMRAYARNADSEILSYDQYKNIFYWLWVIEYANFNSQETYNEDLTDDGYHQGGMGPGVTTINNSDTNLLNSQGPVVPCGYGNDIGNKTGIKTFTSPSFVYTGSVDMCRWRGFDNPFGNIQINLDGIIIDLSADKYKVYTCQDPDKYTDSLDNNYVKVCDGIRKYGTIKLFDLGNAAHIIPSELTSTGWTTYKCDLNGIVSYPINPATLLVGGFANGGPNVGLGASQPYHMNTKATYIGFRTVSLI